MFTEEVMVWEYYIVIALGDIIHNTFEPFEGALLSGNPVEVCSSWPIGLETAT